MPGTSASRFAKIAHFDVRGKFLKFIDNLSFEPNHRKVLVEIFQYDPKPNISVRHSLDVDDFLYLSYLIRTERLGMRPGGENGEAEAERMLRAGYVFDFTDYKGSKSDKSPTGFEAREFRLTRELSRKGPGTVLMLSIKNGPGVLTEGGQGAVKMSPGATVQSLYFPLAAADAVRATFLVEQYLNAWSSHNFDEIAKAHIDWDRRQEG